MLRRFACAARLQRAHGPAALPSLSRAPTLLSRRAFSDRADGESKEEVDRAALQMSRLIRVLAIGWLGSKVYEIMTDGNTYIVAPTITLIRSRNPDNRESGIWRLLNWHKTGVHACAGHTRPRHRNFACALTRDGCVRACVADGALAVAVEQGGVEAVVEALPTALPASRVAIVELLVRIAGLGQGRPRLVATNAADHAASACATIADAAEAQRCQTAVVSLQEALRSAPGPAS